MPTQDFNLVSNGNNFRLFQGPWSAGHAMSQNRSTPTIPSNQRGVGGAFNSMLVDRISLECAGYGSDATVRARVWDSSGTSLGRSAATTLAGVSTSTINVPMNNFDLSPSVLLPGGTLHRWGLWSSNNAIAMQRVPDATFTIYADTSIGASDSWSTGNSQVHASGADSSFAGSFRYFLMPTPPSVSSLGSSESSISFSWSVSDNGGKTISAYVVEYKPSWSGSWIVHNSSYTSTSITISGLSSSTTYDVRVAAKNEVSDLAGTTSDYGTTSITTQAGQAPPPPPPPPPPVTVPVPNLNGLTLSQANSALSNVGLNSSPNPQTSGATSENNNLVIDNTQSPSAGTSVTVGSTVSFSYYSFIPPSQKVSVWNGTSWVISTPKIWNGTSWVDPAVIRIWNGTSWVNPT